MTLARFRSQNHPQQVAERGPKDDIDDRATDPTFFSGLNRRFGFTLDVAASAANAKCERYFDRELNGLLQSWGGHRCGVTRLTLISDRGSERRGKSVRAVGSS